METSSHQYYFQKGFTLLFAILFTGVSIFGLISPENLTVRNNGEIVETNFLNLIPFFIVGGVSALLYLWISKNYFRIRMDSEGIVILNLKSKPATKWNEIESINAVKWFWKGIVFKVILKNRKTFYFYADEPKMSIPDLFNGGFQTKMAEFVESKKLELKI